MEGQQPVSHPPPTFVFTPDEITTLRKFYSMLIMLNFTLLQLHIVYIPSHVVPDFTSAFNLNNRIVYLSKVL